MKPKVNAVSRVVFLFLFFTGGALPLGVSLADQDPTFFRRIQELPPLGDQLETFKPGNLCRVSTIRDNQQTEYTRAARSELTAVIDEDPNTYLTKRCTPDQWLEIRFQGTRKWVNFVEVQYTGGDDFEFEIFDFKGDRRKVNVISADVIEGPQFRRIKTIEFDPVQAKGIRWSWATAGSSSERIDIYEISAWFYQTDPDPNDPTNWLLCETGDPWIGPPDIQPLWYKITALPDWCPWQWHLCHLWIPQVDWSGDFRTAGAGGGENSHAGGWTGMDYHDLSVIACHGTPCRIRFSTGPPITQRDLVPPGDILQSWGDRDAEWFCALSCSPYAWPSCPWLWAQGFDGLHLQCGFTTVAWATNGRFLGGFADLMISTGWWDPALPISLSWFLARAMWQGSGTCVIVLADDPWAYFDHLWGQGWVSPDPFPPGGTVWAVWDPPFSEEDSRSREYPPPLTPKQLESVSEIISGPSSVTIPARSSMGVTVKTTEHLYTLELLDSMTVYRLDPFDVTFAFVESLASGLCKEYGILCEPAIGQDAEGNWWATMDEYALWGDPEQGIIQFVNVDEYIAKKDAAPEVPDTASALSRSQTLLANLGLSPTGSYSTGYTFNVQTAYDLDMEVIVDDSSFNLSINAEFYRIVDDFPVFGPGGYMTLTWGEDLDPQHFTRGGWHNLVDPTVEPVITVEEALELLATIGEEATIGGIPPIYDSLMVQDVEQAYYNTNGEYETDLLEPIYHFSCFAISDLEPFPCDVFVPARTSLLRGAIDKPHHGSWFEEGETVTFIGLATGGTPPRTFDWYSDVEGYLGSGDSLNTNTLSVVLRHSVPMPHRITLTVTDANGTTDDVSISVGITPGCVGGERGDVDSNGNTNVLDVLAVVNHILDIVPITDPDALCRADCKCDDVINILDVVGIVNKILGINDCPPTDCKPGVTPEVMEFLKSLKSFLTVEDFARFMALVKSVGVVPTEFSLTQNYPNPFNAATTIEYALPEAAKVKVEVYNLMGQLVEVLLDGDQEAGYHQVQWDASDVASGVYFYRIVANDFAATKRMVLLK